MASLEEIARTALDGDPLALRSLIQDWLGTGISLAQVPCPATHDPAVLAVSAALAELFAQRTGQTAPAWTSIIPALPEARFLLRSAATMKRLRRMCQEESPWPLKRRNLFAPADYLLFA
ncbi:MAG: hypothetical protein ABSH20_01820 [Tepidisphaeraceae bacterium]|jgi:hypothetical protein